VEVGRRTTTPQVVLQRDEEEGCYFSCVKRYWAKEERREDGPPGWAGAGLRRESKKKGQGERGSVREGFDFETFF
jgi:hypothetical protein